MAHDAAEPGGALRHGERSVGNGSVAAEHPEVVAALQQRLEELAQQSAKPLFLIDQFKVVQKGMHGQPVLPIDDDFAGYD